MSDQDTTADASALSPAPEAAPNPQPGTTPEPQKIYTATEAAAELGCTPRAVRKWINRDEYKDRVLSGNRNGQKVALLPQDLVDDLWSRLNGDPEPVHRVNQQEQQGTEQKEQTGTQGTTPVPSFLPSGANVLDMTERGGIYEVSPPVRANSAPGLPRRISADDEYIESLLDRIKDLEGQRDSEKENAAKWQKQAEANQATANGLNLTVQALTKVLGNSQQLEAQRITALPSVNDSTVTPVPSTAPTEPASILQPEPPEQKKNPGGSVPPSAMGMVEVTFKRG